MKEAVWKILKCKTMYYVLFAIFCVVLYLLDFYNKLVTNNMDKDKLIKIYLGIAIIGSLIVITCIYFIEKLKKMQVHKLFCIAAIVLGLGYMILSPLFTGSDEQNHFYRIYEITDGGLITPTGDKYIGGELPVSLSKTFVKQNTLIKYHDIREMAKVELKKEEKTTYIDEYCNTALYPPIQYAPQIIGMSVGNLLNMNPYFIGMIGRLCNLAFYIAICTIAIKMLPKHKVFAALALLAPAILSTAATLSSDAFTNAIIILFISYVLRFVYSKEKLKKKHLVILGILAVCISICKIVYLPIILLMLFIPKECFDNKKKKMVIFYVSIILLGAILSAVWLKVTDKYFDAYYTTTSDQKSYIFGHLIQYVFIVARSYMEHFIYLVTNVFAGNEMFYAQLKVYNIIPILYMSVVFAAALNEEVENKFSNLQKIIVAIIGLAVIGLIATAIYIQCTAKFIAVGNQMIVGLQGRYFLPVLLLGMFILKPKKKYIEDYKLIKLGIAIQIPMFLTMFTTFLA